MTKPGNTQVSDHLKRRRGRGRPRKYLKSMIEQVIEDGDLTNRGAQNRLLEDKARQIIMDCCSEDAQRFFLGGRTKAEIELQVRKKQRVKRLLLQELGRWSRADTIERAEFIAKNPELFKNQEQATRALRFARLNFTLLKKGLNIEEGRKIILETEKGREIYNLFLSGGECR